MQILKYQLEYSVSIPINQIYLLQCVSKMTHSENKLSKVLDHNLTIIPNAVEMFQRRYGRGQNWIEIYNKFVVDGPGLDPRIFVMPIEAHPWHPRQSTTPSHSILRSVNVFG